MVKFKENADFTKVGLSFGTHTIHGAICYTLIINKFFSALQETSNKLP